VGVAHRPKAVGTHRNRPLSVRFEPVLIKNVNAGSSRTPSRLARRTAPSDSPDTPRLVEAAPTQTGTTRLRLTPASPTSCHWQERRSLTSMRNYSASRRTTTRRDVIPIFHDDRGDRPPVGVCQRTTFQPGLQSVLRCEPRKWRSANGNSPSQSNRPLGEQFNKVGEPLGNG
jgi:hypothetical protein